jgi:DNA-binding LacI/PurR family transcriptional regulator
MRVTIEDVAIKAKVSVNTVSRALNGKDGVSEKTREKIIRIAQEMNYRPNILARSMRQNRSDFVGVSVLDIGNSVFTKMIKGIEKVLMDDSLSIIIGNSDEDVDKERHYLETMLSTNCRGIIISHVNSSGLKFLRHERIPFVVLDRDTQKFECDQVYVDNNKMGYLATKHLLDLGHRDIVFINKESEFDTDHRRRVEGYLQALNEHGLQNMAHVYSCLDAEQGKKTVQEIWKKETQPTGIVIGQHSVAEGVIMMLTQLRIKIPTELSVVIIGEPSWASILTPGFTTIERPLELVGSKAAKLLLDRTQGKIKGDYISYVVSSSLVVRESTGPPPG